MIPILTTRSSFLPSVSSNLCSLWLQEGLRWFRHCGGSCVFEDITVCLLGFEIKHFEKNRDDKREPWLWKTRGTLEERNSTDTNSFQIHFATLIHLDNWIVTYMYVACSWINTRNQFYCFLLIGRRKRGWTERSQKLPNIDNRYKYLLCRLVFVHCQNTNKNVFGIL